MAPSTVFSYLRRDHRRPSSPVAPPSLVPFTSVQSSNPPPQPTGILHSSKRANAIVGTTAGPEAQSRSEPVSKHGAGPERLDATTTTTTATKTTTRLRSPSDPNRFQPQSNCGGGLNPIPRYSEQSPVMKPVSPWKVALGINILSDSSKGPTGGASSSGGNGKGKPSADNTSAEPSWYSRDINLEGISGRRNSGPEINTGHAPPRPAKTRLNLLNPMALLARRRSGQAFNPRPEDIGIGTLGLPAIPDDYDPRIRGNLFHDFSAPRPRPSTLTGNGAAQTQNGHRQIEHTPLFREHFDDDQNASQVKSTDYLDSLFAAYPPPDRDPPAVPSLAEVSPMRLPDTEQNEHMSSAGADSSGTSSALGPRTSAARDVLSRSPSGLPKHLRSNASRFSFDMGGVGSSSQEKLLEDKHKEKEAAKKAKARLDHVNDTDSEDLDYDSMMDDSGLEEKIPGINADADDYADGFSGVGHFSRLVPSAVPALLTAHSNSMPTLELGSAAPNAQQIIQFEDLGSLNATDGGPITASSPSKADSPSLLSLLHSHNGVDFVHTLNGVSAQYDSNGQFGSQPTEDEDDLYFDDGMIEDVPPGLEDEKFDESLFDDETSHLYARNPRTNFSLSAVQAEQQGLDSPPQHAGSDADSAPFTNKLKVPLVLKNIDAPKGSTSRPLVGKGLHRTGPRSSVRRLTEDNLEAYHSALALAANEAAVKGRFQRSMSISDESVDHESVPQTIDSHPGLTSDESRVSQTVDTMGLEDAFHDFNYDDDDGLDDDPIIAAANAEALENDDEGFYGQEFGFYAHSNGNCDTELVLGGYFGPRGVEGITRSHSGRANFQEPSLTPITERSEWSTRNSIISLTTHGAVHPNPPLSNPPLAQLVNMGGIEDEMTLSALMKLRRGAWGGSNGSLRSSAASQGVPSSPQIAQSASNVGSFSSVREALTDQTRAVNSGHNLNSSSEGESSTLNRSDSDYSPASLTLRCDFSVAGRPVEPDRQPQLSIDTANVRVDAAKPLTEGKTHSRNNSAAESVCYVKETDEDGSDRWVLEKRRIAESGESEIVEREVMPYGRI